MLIRNSIYFILTDLILLFRVDSFIIFKKIRGIKVKTIKVLLIFCLTVVLSTNAIAQFVDVTVEISSERMPEKERNDLKILEQILPSYFENYDWIDNKYGIQIPFSIRFFPQSVNTSGFERVFTSQVFISNKSGDQRFLEKTFKFVYNTNDPVMHTDMPHSLTSTLDFYAWMLIAGELDTYEPLGGNTAYEKARDIATRAQMSERPHGFKGRLKELDEILRIRDYRLFKYHYWSIVDMIDQKETKQIPKAIDKALKSLDDVFAQNTRERHTHIFLDVHAREFAEILRDFGNKKQRKMLIELDPDNKNVYEKIFKK